MLLSWWALCPSGLCHGAACEEGLGTPHPDAARSCTPATLRQEPQAFGPLHSPHRPVPAPGSRLWAWPAGLPGPRRAPGRKAERQWSNTPAFLGTGLGQKPAVWPPEIWPPARRQNGHFLDQQWRLLNRKPPLATQDSHSFLVEPVNEEGPPSTFRPRAGRRNCVLCGRKGRPVSPMAVRISPPAFTGHQPSVWSFTSCVMKI